MKHKLATTTIAWFSLTLLTQGQGFGPPQVLSQPANNPSSAFAIDLDGDGDADVLAAVSGDQMAVWYENLGSGQFGPQQAISSYLDMTQTVYATDLDGDGDADVLSGSVLGLTLHENLGGGQFAPQQVIVSLSAHSIHATDLDGDGDQDILLNPDSGALWLENLGGASFGPPQQIAPFGGGQIYATDLDADGDADVLFIMFDDQIFWSENLGGGLFGVHQRISPNGWDDDSIYATDLDGDGDVDVLSGTPNNYDSTFIWYENLGGGQFAPQQGATPATMGGVDDVYATDLDGDGDADVLSVTGSEVTWYKNLGGGQFGPQQSIATWDVFRATLHVTDLDGDGDADVLVSQLGSDTIAWYENLGGGVFGLQQDISESTSGANSVYAADVDGDGDADVLSASQHDNKIAWFENLGNGQFGDQHVISVSTLRARCVHAIDLDGDGDVDVLSGGSAPWSPAGQSSVNWYENLGGGSFGPKQSVGSPQLGEAASVFAIDLDGDGDADVLSTSGFNSSVLWYENLGGGLFGPSQEITSSVNSPVTVYAIDLDGDGDADVLSGSQADDKVAWYENLGGGQFGPQQVILASMDAVSSVHAADVDGDGDADVLSSSYGDDMIAWFENLGNGQFGAQQVISDMVSSARVVYATDLDGDGDADVVASSLALSEGIAWYENLGGGQFGPQQVLQGSGSYIEAVFAGDLDGDGAAEIMSASRAKSEVTWYQNLMAHTGVTFCLGDGAGTACPCGNSGSGTEGCMNSTGMGALLLGHGSHSAAADDHTLHAARLPMKSMVLLLSGDQALNGSNGIIFGDGLRCTGGATLKHGVRAVGASGEVSWGPGLALSNGWVSGEVRHFQGWYRDPHGSPCGTNFNLTNGLTVSYLP